MQKPETRFVKRLRARLNTEFGGFWYKNHGDMFSEPGLPDLTGVVVGIYIGIEAKVGNNETSSDQKKVLRKIRRNGGIAFSNKSIPRAIFLIRKALKQRGLLQAVEKTKASHRLFVKEKAGNARDGDGSRENPYDISDFGVEAYMGKRRSSSDRLPRQRRSRMAKRNKKMA